MRQYTNLPDEEVCEQCHHIVRSVAYFGKGFVENR
jgi:hypothetical protein